MVGVEAVLTNMDIYGWLNGEWRTCKAVSTGHTLCAIRRYRLIAQLVASIHLAPVEEP